ncbi:uncharacterized protein LAJ45_04084 [Morchella importuna]|uniref:uncharacterized protein n=1 Tax=Morchella importuna TaxID=1174673 RepID=UPI001E8D41E9|nr:uncharacterized protein LAJ45_04084 [Morchella importuna]KAH8152090.1 hypothetical protein LAJ45_04084 [Morchella importuna]
MEKDTHSVVVGDASSSSSPSPTTVSQSKHAGMDSALAYIQNAGSNGDEATGASDKSLLRKIDWRIVPIMFACYTMQFVDKVLINYAAVMGLPKDLKLVGNQFTWAATSFFIAYLVAEIPTGYFLQRVPAAKYLAINVALWGVATGCTAACKSFTGLLVARIFLGIFEAAIAPCLTIITSMWYTKKEQPARFGFWYCGLGLGQIVGGIISYGFQHVKNASLEGWRVMFIVLGLVTVLIGVWTFFCLPDTPMSANFLEEREIVRVLERVSENQTGVENKKFKMSQAVELAKDPQIYLMLMITVLCSVSSGVITTYSATLIKNFGYTSPIAALLNMPSGIISIGVTILSGIAVGMSSNRWLWIAGLAVPGALGGALMSFLPNSNKGGLLAGIYLVNSIVAVLIIVFNWAASNIAGHTKRSIATSLIAGAFSIGNIIGPQTFQAKDAPNFYPAKIAVLVTQAGAALFAVLLRFYYSYQNSLKEKCSQELNEQTDDTISEEFKWGNMTDRENTRFRYVY